MYSSVELSCRSSIRRSKVCLEAFTALPAKASICSAVSLRLRKEQTEDKMREGERRRRVTQNNTPLQTPEERQNGFWHRRLPFVDSAIHIPVTTA